MIMITLVAYCWTQTDLILLTMIWHVLCSPQNGRQTELTLAICLSVLPDKLVCATPTLLEEFCSNFLKITSVTWRWFKCRNWRCCRLWYEKRKSLEVLFCQQESQELWYLVIVSSAALQRLFKLRPGVKTAPPPLPSLLLTLTFLSFWTFVQFID